MKVKFDKMKYVVLFESGGSFRLLMSEESDFFNVLKSLLKDSEICDVQQLGLKDIKIQGKEKFDRLYTIAEKKIKLILKTEYDESKSRQGNQSTILGEKIFINLRLNTDALLSFINKICDISKKLKTTESYLYLFERSSLDDIEKYILLQIKNSGALSLQQLTNLSFFQNELKKYDSDYLIRKLYKLKEKNYLLMEDSIITPSFKLLNIYI